MSATDFVIHPPGVPKLPIGVSDFEKLIRESYTFIDKSLLIKDLVEDGAAVNVITRPRRFGKTMNLSMLQYFFAGTVDGRAIEPGLFDGLAISRDKTAMAHRGQYPVVFFSFKDIKETGFDAAADKLRTAVANLFLSYPELVDSPRLAVEHKAELAAFRSKRATLTDLGNAFETLTHYLYLHYGKPVLLLIDEYDTPIHAAYIHGYYPEMIGLMRGLMSGGLKDNSSLYKAVVTGILRIAKESLFSGVNNLKLRTVLDDRYSRYFGFTDDETTGLLDALQLTPQPAETAEHIKAWYNGYQFGGATVYNPWSIISCLDEQGACRPYWVNTSDNALLKEQMARAGSRFKQQLEQLLQGQPVSQLIDPNLVFGDLEKNATALWSLLLFSGYLTADSVRYDRQARATCRLRIPNLEVLGLYERHIEEWFSDSMSIEGYREFLDSLVHGQMDKFEYRLRRYLLESASMFDATGKHPERFYHGFVLGLIAGLRETHVIHSNRESGDGRYDAAILPKDRSRADLPGIIMEFKSADNREQLDREAENALAQIHRKRYQAELEQHDIRHILTIGMAFSGKEFAMRYAV